MCQRGAKWKQKELTVEIEYEIACSADCVVAESSDMVNWVFISMAISSNVGEESSRYQLYLYHDI